ncbi:MAG: PAS domain-containing protein [Planctomycetota bacterium]
MSLLLQLGAAAMALRLVRITGWRVTWVLLAGAITLMAVRRGITLTRVVTGDGQAPDLGAELVALTISVLMVLGVAWLAPLIEGIRRAEREVRQLVESAPEAMLVVDQADTIILANAEAGRLFGAFPYQLKGRSCETLVPEALRSAYREWFSRFWQDPRRSTLRGAALTGLHSLGREFPLEVSVSPLDTADSTLAVMSMRDLSAKLRSEAALASSETRVQTLLDEVLDNTSVGVCIINRDMQVVWVNRAYEAYLGQERGALIGLSAPRVARDKLSRVFEDADGFTSKVLATYEDNTYTEHFECHVLPAGDRWERWIDFWSRPIDSGSYAGGRIEQYADVTERHFAEQRVRQFVDIARNMHVGLLVYEIGDPEDDRSLRIRVVNPEGERLLGIDQETLTGQYIDDAFPVLRDMGLPQLFLETYRSGEPTVRENFEYGDDRVVRGGWKFRAFPLPEQCVGVLFERIPGPVPDEAS